ncbi:MAG: hypothetical protein ACP5U2_12400 [Bryobacteraceae bacterium]
MAAGTPSLRRDYFWWFLGAMLGLWTLWSPDLLRPYVDPKLQTYFVMGGLFIGGVALGFFRPDRPWRWAVASILLLPPADVAALLRNPQFTALDFSHVVRHLSLQVPSYLLYAVPVLVGAYLGSFLSAGSELY